PRSGVRCGRATRGDVPTPTIEVGAVRRPAACSYTTVKRTRWAARTPWTTWSFGVLPTICWRPSRTSVEATWTAGAARRRRASLRRKDLTSRAVAPDLTLQRSQVRKRRDPCAIHAPLVSHETLVDLAISDETAAASVRSARAQSISSGQPQSATAIGYRNRLTSTGKLRVRWSERW